MVYVGDREELSNILVNNNGDDILSYEDKILELVPELIVCNKCEHNHIAHKNNNVYIHILDVVAGLDGDLTLKLAALFHDIGKPYVKKKVNGNVHYWGHEEVSVIIANLALNRIGYDKSIINDVCTLVKIHDKKIKPTINDIKLVVDSIGKINFERLLRLQRSDILSHADEYAEIIIPELDKLKEVYSNNKFR
ncbi:HD domain-containing protein [Clostridium sp. L74]|uniref:HD domain-containing protein n=1 Tax=Clostridium sp. L74 TaxID=1560217 RepID=UPI0006ABB9C4|nr:HD domain-containing protein [Clostridium sp. L74]KOR25022.1 HD domain-containing protein [Clostridium sp. L74]